VNIEKFRTSGSGQLTEAFDAGTPYWAFVPNPLPPKLRFNKSIADTLADASLALGELRGLGHMMQDPLIIQPLIRREAVISSRIEGTQTNVKDLVFYEANQQIRLPGFEPELTKTDAPEVFNYVQAIKYGADEMRSRGREISLYFIRQLHQLLMSGVRRNSDPNPGEFRNVQNYIGQSNSELKDARYVPPPPFFQMRDCLADLERYIGSQDSIHPMVRLALVHYQFEAIHPFVDGNGRVGRMIIVLLMIQWGLLPSPLLSSVFLERNRDQYIDLLLAVSERGAWTEWIVFFLRALAEQARDTNNKARQLLDLREKWRVELSRISKSTRPLVLADKLFELPILTVPRAMTLLDTKVYNTANDVVEKLVEANILKPLDESSYRKTYIASQILDILRY